MSVFVSVLTQHATCDKRRLTSGGRVVKIDVFSAITLRHAASETRHRPSVTRAAVTGRG